MRKITNVHGLSSVFEIALQRSIAEYRNAGWRSTTGLIDAPRIKILTERHEDDLTIDVADALAQIEGTSMHDMLANLGAYEPDVITEKSIILKVLGQDVKMQADRIEPIDGRCGDATKYILKDFKRTKVGAYQAGGRSTWTAQGNIYRMGYNALLGIDIVKVQFELVLANWNKIETVKHDYPEHPIMALDVDLWTYEETMKYLEGRVTLFLQQEKLADDDLAECTATEMWQRPDLFGVWKKKGTTKPYKQFKDKADALDQVTEMKKPEEYEVRFRAGERVRCHGFCDVSKFCSQCRKLDLQEGKL